MDEDLWYRRGWVILVSGYLNPHLNGERLTGSMMKGVIGIVLPVVFRQYGLVANEGSHG